VVLCRTRAQAEQDACLAGEMLAELGLELHSHTTRVVDLRGGREGVDLRGCHFRARMSGRLWAQPRIVRYYLHRWPSARSMKRARRRIEDLTSRKRVGLDLPVVIVS
jgi:RNA-directed DNA polymerase